MENYIFKYKKYKQKYLKLKNQSGGAIENEKKKILLIIDPQNDFHEGGTLAVPNAVEDAKKIAKLIESRKFDEIHVSLDTHTDKHIGHSGFYKPSYEPFKEFKTNTDNLVPSDEELPEDYLRKYNDKHMEKRNLNFNLWPLHCIEKTDGHKIHPIINDALTVKENIVKYHIKGQNELTEMYSIFSATVDPSELKFDNENNLKSYFRYDGEYKDNPYNGTGYKREEGVYTYEEACKMVNLATDMNNGLIKNLLGENNDVYVCGQARSHCVADSIIDLLSYKEKNNSLSEIYLIEDCSSPVAGEDGPFNIPSLDKMKQASEGILKITYFNEIINHL